MRWLINITHLICQNQNPQYQNYTNFSNKKHIITLLIRVFKITKYIIKKIYYFFNMVIIQNIEEKILLYKYRV